MPPQVLGRSVSARHVDAGYPGVYKSGLTYRAAVLADSPSLYWTLNAATGATDQSTGGHNGSGVGGISIGGFAATPIIGETTATDFDFSNDTVASSYSPFTNGRTTSFEGWAWRDNNAARHPIIGNTVGAARYLHILSASNEVRFSPGPGLEVAWLAAWPGVTQWVHWALVYDEVGDSATLYINGATQGARAVAVGGWTTTDAYDVGHCAGTGEFWDGKQAHVAVYEAALSAARVAVHYDLGT